LTFLFITACIKDNYIEESNLQSENLKVKLPDLQSQLKKVKQASMRFHSFEQARKEGYADSLLINPSPYVPNMGFHYISVGFIDGTFELEKPEILFF
jgi:hypothetical protein